jgi:hypothetical protein
MKLTDRLDNQAGQMVGLAAPIEAVKGCGDRS